MPSEAKLGRIIWNSIQSKNKAELKLVGTDLVLDDMPFHALFKQSLAEANPLTYEADGKHISFKPVISNPVFTNASPNAHMDRIGYQLQAGITLEMIVNKSHWRKLVKIDSLASLSLVGNKPVVFTFEVNTDYLLSKYNNEKPRIRLGENSYIEVSKVWDSAVIQVLNDEGEFEGEYTHNEAKVKSYFKETAGKLFFIKEIPADFLKSALFPVYTDVDITYGTAQEFESGTTTYLSCCEIDTNKFVVVFRDSDDGNAGKARIGTVSGTVITWGTTNEFCSDISTGYGNAVACKLDTDKFVVVYGDDVAGDDGYARVGTVATRTISWGTAKEFETGDMEAPGVCQLGTDKFAIAYNDETAGDLGTVCVCTVSTSTITSGTPVAFEGFAIYNSCCKLDTDKFVVSYQDYGDSSKCKCCAFTVSGTVPSAGTIKEIDASAIGWTNVAQLDTDKFALTWQDNTNADCSAVICTVSGTTITNGTIVEVIGTAIGVSNVIKLDATHLLIIYDDLNDSTGKSKYCSFSGTTITLGDAETYHAAYTSRGYACLTDTGEIVICYRDDADVNDIGEAIVGTFGGIAPESKEANDSVVVSDTKSPLIVSLTGNESISASDTKSPLEALFAGTEILTLVDTLLSLGTKWTVSADDIVKLVDGLSDRKVIIGETIKESEGVWDREVQSILDTLVLSDIYSLTVSLVGAQLMYIAESATRGVSLSASETLTFSETLSSILAVLSASETVKLSETSVITKLLTAYDDLFKLSDALQTKGALSSETIKLVDTRLQRIRACVKMILSIYFDTTTLASHKIYFEPDTNLKVFIYQGLELYFDDDRET